MIVYSDGGDWDGSMITFEYPKPNGKGRWMIGEYVPYTDNPNVTPERVTMGSEDITCFDGKDSRLN